MKTLYVSDLDGTLLNSKQHTSSYTNQVINQLVDEGMLFSYATARSYKEETKLNRAMASLAVVIDFAKDIDTFFEYTLQFRKIFGFCFS